jgi:hypothetical protein
MEYESNEKMFPIQRIIHLAGCVDGVVGSSLWPNLTLDKGLGI